MAGVPEHRRPDPSVTALRRVVRDCLAVLSAELTGSTELADPVQPLVLVACSGGPDSLALAAAVADTAAGAGVRAGLISVDHDLQPGSRQRADDVVVWAAERGLSPAEAVTVVVTGTGGPEAAARTARYAALDAAAARHGAAAVLLGHTRDDQAETVLLGLARGSGALSASGMAPRRGVYRRPLLELPRAVTHRAAHVLGLPVWHDPHNIDDRYRRSRVRAILGDLETAIGPGVIAGLSRTGRLLRADAEYLDEVAAACLAECLSGGAPDAGLNAHTLAQRSLAIRGRVLRSWVLQLGVSPGALTAEHVARLDTLLTDWRGQGAVFLPGEVMVARRSGWLRRVGSAAAPVNDTEIGMSR